MKTRIADKVILSYQQLLTIPKEQTDKIGTTYPLPFFQITDIEQLISEATEFLKNTDTLLHIQAPIYVIGDLHGNIFDLIRVFLHAELPPRSRFLFLGDYVDRGPYSIEIVTLLFALMLKYPGHVLLLRGNHEFASINENYGFKNQILEVYESSDLYEKFNEAFSYMPLAAVISQTIFCVHGGISPALINLTAISSIQRPISACEGFISDLVWSDPTDSISSFEHSQRGSGFLFGPKAVEDFCNATGLKSIIRAHQCVQKGIERSCSNRVYTVFSCSNYSEGLSNGCGIVFITQSCEIKAFSLPPYSFPDKNKVSYQEFDISPITYPKKSSPPTLSLTLIEREQQRQRQFAKTRRLILSYPRIASQIRN